jgi:hypothetical protein
MGHNGVLKSDEAEKRKQEEFFDLAERFRSATDPDEVEQLGDEMGRMVFGGSMERTASLPRRLSSRRNWPI